MSRTFISIFNLYLNLCYCTIMFYFSSSTRSPPLRLVFYFINKFVTKITQHNFTLSNCQSKALHVQSSNKLSRLHYVLRMQKKNTWPSTVILSETGKKRGRRKGKKMTECGTKGHTPFATIPFTIRPP